jgi:hypothetical protein
MGGKMILRAAILLLLASCTKTPEAAAKLYNFQTDNGFKAGAGVSVTDQHILADLSMFADQKRATVVDSAGKQYGAVRLGTNEDSGVALLYLEDDVVPKAKICCTDDLSPGDKLATYVYDEDGKGTLLTGTFRKWQYGEGVAWLVSDIDAPEESVGAGFFGPNGRLVGILAMKRARASYILPLEYVLNGPTALTSGLLGDKTDSETFAAHRKKGEDHPEVIPEPLVYDDVGYEFAFSRTALVAALTLLDTKSDPAAAAAVRYRVEGVDNADNRTEIASGTIDKDNQQSASLAEDLENLKREAAAVFGEEFVQKEMDPYDYIELRLRLPYTAFCSKAEPDQVYVWTVELADGRKVSENFNDMVNMCAGSDEAPGDEWEEEWGMGGGPVAAAAPPGKVKRKGKGKGKRKRKGKGKRRRRRR